MAKIVQKPKNESSSSTAEGEKPHKKAADCVIHSPEGRFDSLKRPKSNICPLILDLSDHPHFWEITK